MAERWKICLINSDVNTRRKLHASYLMNHTGQQAKSQKITPLQEEFNKVITESLEKAYQTFPSDMRTKIFRVVTIWRDRSIFSRETVRQLLKKMEAIDQTKSEQSSVPPKLKDIVAIISKVTRNEHHIRDRFSRFQNSINELDTSSAVYTENFQTVSKIAHIAKDAIDLSMKQRMQIIDKLQKLIDSENKSMEEEQTMICEIDFLLSAKDPSNINDKIIENDMMPTY